MAKARGRGSKTTRSARTAKAKPTEGAAPPASGAAMENLPPSVRRVETIHNTSKRPALSTAPTSRADSPANPPPTKQREVQKNVGTRALKAKRAVTEVDAEKEDGGSDEPGADLDDDGEAGGRASDYIASDEERDEVDVDEDLDLETPQFIDAQPRLHHEQVITDTAGEVSSKVLIPAPDPEALTAREREHLRRKSQHWHDVDHSKARRNSGKAQWQRRMEHETAVVSDDVTTLSGDGNDHGLHHNGAWPPHTHLVISSNNKVDMRDQTNEVQAALHLAIEIVKKYLAFGSSKLLSKPLSIDTIAGIETPMSPHGASFYASTAIVDACDQSSARDILTRFRQDSHYSTPLTKLVSHRLSVDRGNHKKEIRRLVPVFYRLESEGLINELLREHGYIYYQDQTTGVIDRTRIYQARVILPALQFAFFGSEGTGAKHPESFLSSCVDKPAEVEISPYMIAYVMSLVELGLLEHRTSAVSKTQIELKESTFDSTFQYHMTLLYTMKNKNLPAYHKLMHGLYLRTTGHAGSSHATVSQDILAHVDFSSIVVVDQ